MCAFQRKTCMSCKCKCEYINNLYVICDKKKQRYQISLAHQTTYIPTIVIKALVPSSTWPSIQFGHLLLQLSNVLDERLDTKDATKAWNKLKME